MWATARIAEPASRAASVQFTQELLDIVLPMHIAFPAEEGRQRVDDDQIRLPALDFSLESEHVLLVERAVSIHHMKVVDVCPGLFEPRQRSARPPGSRARPLCLTAKSMRRCGKTTNSLS